MIFLKAAVWIRKLSAKIAKVMDKGEKSRQKNSSQMLLFKMGAPRDAAKTLAKFIVNLI
ncbi:hypothetical protein C2W58_03625 [Bacillus pumilus]|uniref:Uncharacterized protein n=1 Tax=Bacillus pumilus TaxID=1408 RepID=A0AB34QS33_BACPU|nr:hypothetical protein B4127_0709 [Bacillus pumilus]RAP11974.1 hypothetical protein C2W58_03625 [Bacillus pumilus]